MELAHVLGCLKIGFGNRNPTLKSFTTEIMALFKIILILNITRKHYGEEMR